MRTRRQRKYLRNKSRRLRRQAGGATLNPAVTRWVADVITLQFYEGENWKTQPFPIEPLTTEATINDIPLIEYGKHLNAYFPTQITGWKGFAVDTTNETNKIRVESIRMLENNLRSVVGMPVLQNPGLSDSDFPLLVWTLMASSRSSDTDLAPILSAPE